MKKIIIVGAGIAGLAAGVYAAQSGFDTTIYESHSIPGGASTSWRRGGYLFEGGMHWLTGSSPKTQVNRLWREVGALNDSVPVYNRDPFFTFAYNGQSACLYRDVDTLRRHFLSISPEDKKEIDRLCRDVKTFTRVQMPLTDIKGVRVKNPAKVPVSLMLGMLPAIPRMGFYNKLSVAEYARRFKSPLLRLLLENSIGPDYSASALLFTIATLASGDGGYPAGGSLAMAKRIAETFRSLGGTIRYNTPVETVAISGGAADGVIVGGALETADAVIVTKDTLSAIDTLFDEPIHEPWAERMRQNTKPMLNAYICLGVEADLSDLPENVSFQTDVPVACGNIQTSVVGFNNYARYEGYAPEGCTALTAAIMGDSYDFWKACRDNGTYEAEKAKLANAYIRALSEQYPQIRGKVAVWDVATPLTYERYLGSYKGSWMTLMEKGQGNVNYPCKPESIEQLYFAGQRLTTPGGLPIALQTGRTAVQHVCLDTDTLFQGAL
jgi:phytoene dehydrogenase-like protein